MRALFAKLLSMQLYSPLYLGFISPFPNSGSPATPAHPPPAALALPGHNGHGASVCQCLLEEEKGSSHGGPVWEQLGKSLKNSPISTSYSRLAFQPTPD